MVVHSLRIKWILFLLLKEKHIILNEIKGVNRPLTELALYFIIISYKS